MTNKEALSARMSRVAMSVTGLGPRRSESQAEGGVVRGGG
jgi:hypothetical protein